MLSVEQLQKVASLLIKAYRTEIVRDGEWWFGIDDYDFNIWSDDSDLYNINVYEHNGKGMDKYSHWIDLPQVYLGEKQ
jgi:hypothetical protein